MKERENDGQPMRTLWMFSSTLKQDDMYLS